MMLEQRSNHCDELIIRRIPSDAPTLNSVGYTKKNFSDYDEESASLILRGHILSISSEDQLRPWDGEQRLNNRWHDKKLCAAWELTNDLLITTSLDGLLQLWHKKNGSLTQEIVAHSHAASGVLSLSDNSFASWAKDNCIRIWQTSSGVLMHDLFELKGAVKGVLVLDSDRIITWSFTKTLQLWSLSTGKLIRKVPGHPYYIKHVFKLKNGNILSVSFDGTVIIWDAESMTMMTSYSGINIGFFDCNIQILDTNTLSDSDDEIDENVAIIDITKKPEIIKKYKKPWILSVPYPSPWEDKDYLCGAYRFGSWWAQVAGNTFYVVNRKTGVSAKWYGGDLSFVGLAGQYFAVASDSKGILLEMVDGGSCVKILNA